MLIIVLYDITNWLTGILSNVIYVIEAQKDAIGDIDELIHLQQMTIAPQMIAKQ